jgi:hypothetical protein
MVTRWEPAPRSSRKTRRREREVDAGTNDGVGPSAPTRLHRSGIGPTPEVRAFATDALHSVAGAWRKAGEPAIPATSARRSAVACLRTGNRIVQQRGLASFIGRVRDRTRDACSSHCPPGVPLAVSNRRLNHRRPRGSRTMPLVVGACRRGGAPDPRARKERGANGPALSPQPSPRIGLPARVCSRGPVSPASATRRELPR